MGSGSKDRSRLSVEGNFEVQQAYLRAFAEFDHLLIQRSMCDREASSVCVCARECCGEQRKATRDVATWKTVLTKFLTQTLIGGLKTNAACI